VAVVAHLVAVIVAQSDPQGRGAVVAQLVVIGAAHRLVVLAVAVIGAQLVVAAITGRGSWWWRWRRR